MPIARQHGQIVLERQGRNPRVVGGNGLSSLAEAGVMRRRLLADRQELESRQVHLEPVIVGRAVTRIGDSVQELPEHDDRDCGARLAAQDIADSRCAIEKRR
jgi:hypothetical protein